MKCTAKRKTKIHGENTHLTKNPKIQRKLRSSRRGRGKLISNEKEYRKTMRDKEEDGEDDERKRKMMAIWRTRWLFGEDDGDRKKKKETTWRVVIWGRR